MNFSQLRVLIVDDDVFKTADIRKALEFNNIRNIISVRNQEAFWEEIEKTRESGEEINVIVTDMQYPLLPGDSIDPEAGLKLIEKLKEKEIDIPVIVCSSLNYSIPEALGSVWYSNINDIEHGFKKVLEKLKN